ncbi:glycosyltransferase family 4 protein [Sphingomonas sp. CJ99]
MERGQLAPMVPSRTGPVRAVRLDLSRLLARSRHPTPTGIDRTELAYADALLGWPVSHVEFEAWWPGIGFRPIRRSTAARLVDAIRRSWDRGLPAPGTVLRGALRDALLPAPRTRTDQPITRLIVSHRHLERLPTRIARRARPGDRLVLFIHDAIPSTHPEYARPGGTRRHDLRLSHAAAHADALIVNSHDTARQIERFVPADRTAPPILVAPLGLDLPGRAGPAPLADEPYFVCIGTIEPRKNHLLLLHLWRRMAETMPASAIPKLHIVGRRGWENENIVDLLDRCRALRPHVVESARLGDAALNQLMSGARALLMPSFAEGFGLPVIEALASGVPVIASDLGVYREVAGDVPDYRDPLDGPGWLAAILDHAAVDSALRTAQRHRMALWQPPSWDDHFGRVLPFLDQLA